MTKLRLEATGLLCALLQYVPLLCISARWPLFVKPCVVVLSRKDVNTRAGQDTLTFMTSFDTAVFYVLCICAPLLLFVTASRTAVLIVCGRSFFFAWWLLLVIPVFTGVFEPVPWCGDRATDSTLLPGA